MKENKRQPRDKKRKEINIKNIHYSIIGFNQITVLACQKEINDKIVKLNGNDLMILRWFYDLCRKGKDKEKYTKINPDNGLEYRYIKYSLAVNAFPLFNYTNQTVMSIFKKFVQLKILDHFTYKIGGTYACYRINNEMCYILEQAEEKEDHEDDILNEKLKTLSKILDTPPYYFIDRHLKILDNKDTIGSITIGKDKITDSNESDNPSLNKNNTLKDNVIALNKSQESCVKFFDYWYNENSIGTKHKKDIKNNTYIGCLNFFRRLKAGTTYKFYEIDGKTFYSKADIKDKKFTDEEIYNTLDEMRKYLIDGYGIKKEIKDKLLKGGLAAMLYNSYTHSSWFLSAYFNPPKSLKKNITTSNEKLYNIVRGIFDDLSEAEEQKLIYETEALWKKFDELYDKIHPYGTYLNSSHAGSRENPERLVRNFAEYHKQHNFDRKVGKVGPDTTTFKNFLRWMKEEHDCNLNPTERELKIMKIDYENYQMRKRNRS